MQIASIVCNPYYLFGLTILGVLGYVVSGGTEFANWVDPSMIGLSFFFGTGHSCGSGTGNCSDSSSGNGGSGCSGGGGSSTPFLLALNQLGKEKILNDVLIGNPSSYFFDKDRAARQFAAGKVGYDLYPVPLKSLGIQSGEFQFKLKEIEPEESFIHNFSYSFVTVPHNEQLVIENTHQRLFSLANESPLSGSVKKSDGQELSTIFTRNHGTSCSGQLEYIDHSVLLSNDTSLFLQIPKSTEQQYLSIGAFWRELLGRKHYQPRVAQLESKNRRVAAGKQVTSKWYFKKPLVASMLSLVSALLPFSSVSVDDASLLHKAFTYTTAHASVPKSLYFYYKSVSGAWKQFAIIHPRHILAYNTIVKLPEHIYRDGVAEIKITSTQDHYIYSLGIATGVSEIVNKEFTPVSGSLNGMPVPAATSVQPLTTTAGDEFSFTIPVPSEPVTHVVFKLHGYYSPLPALTDRELSVWWNKLKAEEQALYLA